MTEEDKSLFLEAMKNLEDVTPIKKGEHQPLHDAKKQQTAQKELLRSLKRKQKKVSVPSRELSETKAFDFSGSKVTAFESLFFSQPGVRQQELTKLKKSEFKIGSTLDLHGMTLLEAEREIDDFIALNHARNNRYVRIIHGKGYNSEDDYPALKNLANQILRQLPEVVAFISTPEKDGGVGALNILLKAG